MTTQEEQQSVARLHALVELEAVVLEQAKVALELRNPAYANAFREALPRGLDAAMAAARPHLGPLPWWYELLTSLLSVELAMDHVKHALSLMNTHRSDDRHEDGRLLCYHVDNWVILSTALLEKADHLICRVYRVLVRRVDPAGYNDKLQAARAHLVELAARHGNVRNPLVHPLGGPTLAIEEDRLWEAQVLIGATAADVIDGHYGILPSFRDRWCQGFTVQSGVVIAAIEAAFARAARDVRNEP